MRMMPYILSNTRNGKTPIYKTELRIENRPSEIVFHFMAEHSAYYCPYSGYNDNHYEGDACEVFIGVEPDRSRYFEIEVTPNNGLFFGIITYSGKNAQGAPITSIQYVDEKDCFVCSKTEKTSRGYNVEIAIDKVGLQAEGKKLFFNAYRIETDGGERDKHLFALNPTMQSVYHVPERFVPLDYFCE